MTVARDRLSGSHRLPRGPTAQLIDVVTGRPAPAGTKPIGRLVVLIWLIAFLILLANKSGQIFFDTKLGVDIDPAGFFGRLWQLWNPNEWFGTLSDQYIGYAFPMAPFYLLAALAKVPVWVTERLWLSLLIAVGFTGMVKLARALAIGTDRSRIVAGLAFALWPTFTIVIGSTSAGLLPGLLAPWAVLPLVDACRGGDPVRAAARSGVAVLCMGGVNATSTLDALILPAAFILVGSRGRQLLKLGACWLAAVGLATSWWVVPLLLQARYSFNFLPYIEQSATTTATMSASTFLRGAGNWTAYLNLGQPWLSAGWVAVTEPFMIIAAAVAAGVGLFGLSRRDLPCGGWLRICLGLAALTALAGYPGSLGGLFHQPVDQLLNSVLAPLRSVYKVEPVAAAVLALGIAHALVLRATRPALVADPAPRVLWHLFTAPAIALIMLGLAYPYVSGQVLNPGPFRSVPGYWYQAASYIKAHSPRAPVLLVPGAAHGTFLWGETVDEPLEPLANSPWVEQGLVPYGGAGSQLLLSSLEQAITSGERVPGLAATLARSGIRYVVVRNDLNPSSLDYASPQTVHQTLASSGFVRIAAFGPLITGAQTDPGASQIQYALPSYPAIEIFAARSAAGTPMPAAATLLPVSKTVLVNGGPDALLQLTGQHILGPAPAVIAGDKLVATPAVWAVTDTLPRADHAFGLVDATPSFTYTATEVNPAGDPLGGAGQPPRQLLPVPAGGHQTVAVLSGAASVTASSSGSWLAESPQIDPVNAFDRDPSTYWTEASPSTPVGQWIQITFAHLRVLPRVIRVQLLVSGSLRPVADQLTTSTAAGTVTTDVRKTGSFQAVRVVPGLSRTLRITIAGARGQVPGGPGAGITGITIPGVTVTRYQRPAEDPAGFAALVQAFSFHRQVPSPASLADVAAYPPLDRIFATPAGASFRLAASAIAVPGQRLDALLAKLTPVRRRALVVTASSTWGSLPDLEPVNLFKAGQRGSWIAGAGRPVLRLSWRGQRTVRRMVIQSVPGFGAEPESIKIESPDGVRYASIGLDGITEIVPPLTTSRMSISFPVVQYTTAGQTGAGQQPAQLPVGLSKLSIPALNGLSAVTPTPTTKFTLACGSGPLITIDGQRLPTVISGTVGDLTAFRPVHVKLCSPGSAVLLQPGQHRLRTARPSPFTVTDLSLASVAGQAAAPSSADLTSAGGRQAAILAWQPEYRQVRVGPGVASYLELHQNANAGWTATLDGRRLASVVLDGWQQGFVVPAGTGGVITLTFGPVKFYHAWIILSAVGAFALLALALTRRRRRRVHDQMDRALTRFARPNPPSSIIAPPVTASAVTASDSIAPGSTGPGSAGQPAAPTPVSSGLFPLIGLAALSVLILIIGGPVVIAVPVLALVAYFWPRWQGSVALGAMIASGLFAAFAAHPSPAGSGAFGGMAQALALIALIAALMPGLAWVSESCCGWPAGAWPATGAAVSPVRVADQALLAVRRAGRVVSAPAATGQELGQPETSSGQAGPGLDRPGRARFAVADELTCYYDRPAEPANVHVEAAVTGRLDEAAVRAAVAAVLRAEQGLRVRRARGSRWSSGYYWEFGEAADADPVLAGLYASEAELADLRSSFLSQSPPLDQSPPARFLLACGPAGDVLILNAHHARFDGLSSLRLLRCVADQYTALTGQDRAGPAGLTGAAGLTGPAGLTGATTRAARQSAERPPVSLLSAPLPPAPLGPAPATVPAATGRGRVARIAAQRDAGSPGALAGYGACQRTWDGLAGLANLKSAAYSVNDVLIAALVIAIGAWNTAHGARPRPARITMPVGEPSQAGPDGQWANRSRLTTVTASAGQAAGKLLADVAAQTRHAKDHAGGQVGPLSSALAAAPVPVAAKQLLLRTAMHLAGPFVCDTSLISNLGVVGQFQFGSLPGASVWFSTSAHMPRGLSLGAVTTDGRLRLTFRYRRALFADPAAGAFADGYLAALDGIAGWQARP